MLLKAINKRHGSRYSLTMKWHKLLFCSTFDWCSYSQLIAGHSCSGVEDREHVEDEAQLFMRQERVEEDEAECGQQEHVQAAVQVQTDRH